MLGSDFERKRIKSAETFFSRWTGATAVMHELTTSIKQLRLVIRREGQSRDSNLVIACIDPVFIKGPIWWRNCKLGVEAAQLPNSDEIGYRVFDEAANLEVFCGLLEVKENVKM